MIGRLFRAHGEFCTSHPWEVIVSLFTATACMMSIDKSIDQAGSTSSAPPMPGGNFNETQYNAADIILMATIRCSAVLYCYYQFRNLHKLGSKYILGIAALFTVFSSFIFISIVINFLGREVYDLKDAIFFFLLLIDLPKAGTLAQLALSGSNSMEVTTNIARGMEFLGPGLSLDTIVETLVIGVGTLSGVHRLEILCGFAILSAVVNYVVFMTFYPACLSLILNLSHYNMAHYIKAKDSILLRMINEEEQKPNPVVQRVKLIMSTGLMMVHLLSRTTFIEKEVESHAATITGEHADVAMNMTEPTANPTEMILRWLTVSVDKIIVLIILAALTVKFVFLEGRNESDQTISEMIASRRKVSDQQTNTSTMDLTASSQSILPIIEIDVIDKETQTDQAIEDVLTETIDGDDEDVDAKLPVAMVKNCSARKPRSVEECICVMNSEEGAASLTDEEITMLVKAGGGHCPLYKIETILGDPERGVKIRRGCLATEAKLAPEIMENLPYKHYDYTKVMNACCENVLGYVQIPVGYAGPLLLDGVKYFVPMATTEGALVASTNRGCKAISTRGVKSVVEDIGMTRAPCVRFESIQRAAEVKAWIEHPVHYAEIKSAFDSTSRFARLKEIMIGMDGPSLYLRFSASTGDAMGMNMVSKGAEMALTVLRQRFPDMEVISLSGNFCSDKKPAAINWIKGRGKKVVCETVIPADKLRSILKTDARTLVRCNKLKNMSGSALAGSIGGNNAHAANMVTAVFIATGQDPAQNVSSSNCSTIMECCGENDEDLYMTCTMPSMEVGTVGGGTILPGQGACLEMLGVKGAHPTHPASNSKKLATVICATVMAGELSLMAALVNSDLVKSHMRHNRSSVAVNPFLTTAAPQFPHTSTQPLHRASTTALPSSSKPRFQL